MVNTGTQKVPPPQKGGDLSPRKRGGQSLQNLGCWFQTPVYEALPGVEAGKGQPQLRAVQSEVVLRRSACRFF